jgi:hypothetical protein
MNGLHSGFIVAMVIYGLDRFSTQPVEHKRPQWPIFGDISRAADDGVFSCVEGDPIRGQGRTTWSLVKARLQFDPPMDPPNTTICNQ